jgi:transposase
MSKIYHVDLRDSERLELLDIVKRLTSKTELFKRSQILLACDRLGDKVWTDKKISITYGVSLRTVERLRERFVEDGLWVALKGKPRLNLDKIKFDGDVETQLVLLRCSDAPEGSSRWTLNLLGDKLVELKIVESISHESVRQLLKKTKLSLGELRNG